MGEKQNSMTGKRIIDIAMCVLLLCLMAFQVTGEQAHEWLGIGMTALVIVHQILNRRWYGVFLKGKYNPYRILQTAVNGLLLLSFVLTAFSGMSMSGYAVPFLYGMAKVSLARRMHLSMSHWAFVLMGLHIGLHIPVITARRKLTGGRKGAAVAGSGLIAAAGLFFLWRNGVAEYLLFRVPFAFLDFEKPIAAVFLENVLMLLSLAVLGAWGAVLCRRSTHKNLDCKQQSNIT
jgi:hypothetical protein